jgi:SPP1 gp7 family putative phage head morphogenesis protein
LQLLTHIKNMDPTRTTGLRTRFASNAARRFTAVKGVIRKSIVDNDCFGMTAADSRFILNEEAPTASEPRQFDFPRSQTKVDAFMRWLRQQEQKGILEMIHRPGRLPGIEDAWTDIWISRAYEKGVVRGRQEMRKIDPEIPVIPVGDQAAITAVMRQPFHADRLGLLFTRTFSDLKNITQEMDTQISRVLTEGLMRGANPRAIARDLNNRVDKIGITRARAMARTEIVRAHHVATVQEYRHWGVEEVTVQAEFLTAGFNVCPKCVKLAAHGPYTLDEIEGMIPVHPNCRCCAIPVNPNAGTN